MAKGCQAASINMWPLQKTAHVVTNQMATEVFMRRERRRLQARFFWDKLRASRMMRSIDASFFMTTRKNPGGWRDRTGAWVQQQWKNCQAWFAGQAVARSPSKWISALYLHGLDQLDALSWQWINQHENLVEQVWHTQQGTFRCKRPPDVREPVRSSWLRD